MRGNWTAYPAGPPEAPRGRPVELGSRVANRPRAVPVPTYWPSYPRPYVLIRKSEVRVSQLEKYEGNGVNPTADCPRCRQEENGLNPTAVCNRWKEDGMAPSNG